MRGVATEKFELRFKPKDFFEDYCIELDDRLANEKRLLKSYLKDSGMEVAATDDVAQLYTKVSSANIAGLSSKTHLNVLLLEMVEKAKWKVEEKRKKQAELDKDLDDLFVRKVPLPTGSSEDGEVVPSWATVRDLLAAHSGYRRYVQNAKSSEEGEALVRRQFELYFERERARAASKKASHSDSDGALSSDEDAGRATSKRRQDDKAAAAAASGAAADMDNGPAGTEGAEAADTEPSSKRRKRASK